MATVPLSASNVRFLSDVPFFNDYSDVRYFKTKLEQTTYFNSRPTVYEMTQATFQRQEKGSFIAPKVSVDKLYNATYVSFTNADFGGKTFYGFITHLEYVNKNVTNVYINIDVYQTWLFDVSFKPSYIEREHQTMWLPFLKPVVNTIPEALEHGSMYEIVNEVHIPPSDLVYLVVITSKEITDGATVSNINFVGTPTPLFHYVIPYKRVDGALISVGGNMMIPFASMMEQFSTNEDIVNSIQTMYVSDYVGINFLKGDGINYTSADVETRVLKGSTFHICCVKDMFNFRNTSKTISDIFSKFEFVTESKLMMYPYCLIELDDLKGNRIEIKPELLMGDALDVVIKGNIGYTNKVMYEVKNYNTKAMEFVSTLQNSIIDTNPNDIPVITEYLSSMMQGQRNSLQTRKDNAKVQGATTALNGSINGLASSLVNPVMGIANTGSSMMSGATHAYTEIKSVNAQIQDASAVPPNVQKMGGITSFDYGYNLSGVRVVFKQIRKEYRDSLTDYFKKYGYKTNRIKMPNLDTRTSYNFVKTIGCTAIGSLNNDDLQEFKNIFDKGVTLWHTNDVGNYLLGNEVK